MRGVSQAWPARLLAAALALALVVAGVVGAHAHAAGHALPAAEHAAAAVDAGHHMGHHGQVASTSGQIGNADGCDGDGVGHSPDCCDTMCHGGHAILVAYALVPLPTLYAPLLPSVVALHGAGPVSLDRPPKPFRPA
jgi:hypothetical protein